METTSRGEPKQSVYVAASLRSYVAALLYLAARVRHATTHAWRQHDSSTQHALHVLLY